VALSNGIGPLIGAAYAQKASWWVFLAVLSEEFDTNEWLYAFRRWIFRMNMPLAVVASVCVYFFMPLKKVEGTVLE
jgi:hypothetical protein